MIRTKERTFIYSKTLINYTGKRIPTIVNCQGCTLNVLIMQGYREAEDYYYVKYMTTKKVIDDRYIRMNHYDKKKSMKHHKKEEEEE